MSQPLRFVERRLGCGSTYTRERTYLINAEIAEAMMLDLTGYDREYGTLPLGVMLAEVRR